MVLPPGEPAAGPWRVLPVVQLVERLRAEAPAGRPWVIAVDGRSGGGKTTLAGTLAAVVPGSVVVHTDDVAWHHSFFDWADLLAGGVLEPARRGARRRWCPAPRTCRMTRPRTWSSHRPRSPGSNCQYFASRQSWQQTDGWRRDARHCGGPIGMTTARQLTVRRATLADVPLLATFNRHLIEDQLHRSQASDDDLADRMRRWLSSDLYRVAIVDDGDEPVAYAVWRDDEDGIYVRQFFVARHRRRAGLGRRAFTLLADRWRGTPVKLDALVHNERALGFWRALGFRDYSIILHRDPD